MTQDNTARMRDLNDQLRKHPYGGHGRVVITAGVNAYGPEFVASALKEIAAFDAFTADNDPHGEHDFGIVTALGSKLFFKVDYYNLDLSGGSEDPSDPAQTTRVMTVMWPNEY